MTTGAKKARRARAVAFILVTLLAIGGVADANPWNLSDPSQFAPEFLFKTDHLTPDANTSHQYEIGQNISEDVVSKYNFHIPTGYRYAVGSIKPAAWTTQPTFNTNRPCALASTSNATNVLNAESIAFVRVVVGLDSGVRATYNGAVFFVRWVPGPSGTGTANLCMQATTTSGSIAAANRTFIFPLNLTKNADASWDLTWTPRSATATPGQNSFIDSTYYQTQGANILDSLMAFPMSTAGNYNATPSGVKTKVPFPFNPVAAGTYTHVATISPCGTDPLDPALCDKNSAPVDLFHPVGISSSVTAVHSMPFIQTPAKWGDTGWAKPIMGTNKVPVSWNRVADTPVDAIKGYVVFTGEYFDLTKIHFDYIITNPNAQGYDSNKPNPCGPDGAAATCALELSFPLIATNGAELGVNGVYSTGVIAVFMDGHRSEGRCDDGSGPGAPAPCPDGSTPRVTYPDGYTFSWYMLRSKKWPLAYGKTTGSRYNSGFELLLVDLEKHEAEYTTVRAEPAIPYKVYRMSGPMISGTNSPTQGYFLYADNTNTSGEGMGVQAILNGNTIQGYREFFCRTTIQWLNCGKPFPASFNYSKL